MSKRVFKILFALGIAGFILSTVSWYSIRYISTQKASQKAKSFIGLIKEDLSTPPNEDQKIIAITRQVFKSFHHQNPSTIPLYKARPYITNKRLPFFVRFPEGVMETNIQAGLCDNASRMLAFILKQEGYSSVQWNMVTDRGGHSARMVTLSDGRKVFVDPFYGLVAIDKSGQLTDLQTAQNRIKTGEKLKNTLISLGPNADSRFYQNLDKMFMAAEGEKLTIKAKVPLINGKQSIALGNINGQENDVKKAAQELQITPYWYYIGHKYSRGWVRKLEAQQPIKINMTLVEPPDPGALTATPAPNIEGKTLTWNLKAGETLTFHDGLAKISLERLNSYINVDQIVISLQN